MHDTHTAEHAHHELGFVRKYIFSTDHKVIGLQYLLTAMAMAIVGGVLSMLMRLAACVSEDASALHGRRLLPDAFQGGLMKPEFYVSLVTMHGTIMVFFLFTAVLTGGFGNFLIPLQIGARDMAFPFLNALSYWVFLLSCIVIFGALFVTGGAPLGGWTGVCAAQRGTCIRSRTGSRPHDVDHRHRALHGIRSDGRFELCDDDS